jgi:peptidoglycan/xylan/chitin deacetylase (PgdA/CDA1 family)
MNLPPPHPRRRWQPTPLIWLSLSLHLAAVPLLLLYPASWSWIAVSVLLDQLWLTAAGLWPRSRSLGPNWVRLPAGVEQIAITIDDGPDPVVTPQVLDLLDRFGARASFFCIGEQARRHPELCREIVRRGHAVENHSQNHHHHFALFGPWRMAREIATGQETLTGISGQRPLFFRPTAGLRNPFSGADPGASRPAVGELDPARLRHAQPRRRRRGAAVDAPACRLATSCCCTMAMPPAPRPVCR